VSAGEDVSYIFSLTEMKPIGGASNLDAKEVVERSQIFNRKLLLHPGDKSSDDMRMCTCNNDVVNIYKEKNFDIARGVKEE
jgi:hypothetical protein